MDTLTIHGRYMYTTGADDRVLVWDIRKRQLVRELDPFYSSVNNIQASSKLLTVATYGNSLSIFDRNASMLMYNFEVESFIPNDVHISCHSHLISCADGNNVRLWNIRKSDE